MFRLRHLLVSLLVLVTLASAQQPSSAAIDQRVNSILSQMTLEEKIDYIGGVDGFYVRAVPRLHLPALKMSDGPLGVRNYGLATAYPAGIAEAATWDPALIRRIGESIGNEARARGVHFMLGPGVNIYRAPMGGRDFEYFGEDPFLASRMAVAWIEGVQSKGVSATVKHYAANNQEYDRHNVSSNLDERTLREIYLPAFEAAVREAHVGAIMDSYNPINGVHATENKHLNIEIAKKDWGFAGVIMSDWDATYDGVAAANGGLDLEMPSGKFMNRQNLLPAVKDGRVSEETINDHVRRILRDAVRFGWLDREQQDLSIPNWNHQAQQVALQAARESITLLKNDRNLLPLDKTKVRKIAIIGPDAHPAVTQGGGSAHVNPITSVSYLQGIADFVGSNAQVYYAPGAPDPRGALFGTHFSNGSEQGLKGEYFNNADLSGSPALTRNDRMIMFHWSGGYAPNAPEDFSVRWTGSVEVPTPGEYRVWVVGTHLFRVFIDGKQVVDNWAPTEVSHQNEIVAPVNFTTTGAHSIRIEDRSTKRGWLNSGDTPSIAVAVVPVASVVPADAVKLAANADVAIVCVGFNQYSESEGFDRTFALPQFQDDLIRAIAAANKNTIVVLTAGGNVDMSRWLDQVPALVHAWYAGQEGGTALAEILFGATDPSGRLPVTFERRWDDNPTHDSYYPQTDKQDKYTEGIFVGYRGYEHAHIQPLFPFGFGLSYTTFKYANIAVSPQTMSGDSPVTVSFDVTNTGSRAGADVAQLYVADTHARVPMPPKELKGFARVELRPGETRHVTIPVDRRALSYYDVNQHAWTADPGTFEILVGRSSADIQLRTNLSLK